MQTLTVWHAAGEKGGTRGRAAWLGVAGRELQSNSGNPVEVWGWRAHCDISAVATEVSPSHNVHKKYQNVGLLFSATRLLRRRFDLIVMYETGFKIGSFLNGAGRDHVKVGYPAVPHLGVCRAGQPVMTERIGDGHAGCFTCPEN